ncbi:Lnb N-terminal periplasmic domain-containing protein [Pseudozobellia thermophila]|uniref:Lnb N-terminal periplasmic domain-containing protein n=1 Tax=Pseudozobellia thermophila TaxID=192903 RepID=UPI001FCDE1AA|nr:DUF4105 domain-containing protein [Pseudozobellia thermophila]
MKKVLFILFAANCLLAFSQKVKLTPQSKISVITCGPGDQIYSTFGHSAFRVDDRTQGIDVVYNYGTFDFTTPNFTLKFARGKLDYTLARQGFRYFLLNYEEENRWVKEQVLNLNLHQKQQLFDYLENNYLPENRDYKYDFFYNNCATKIWDVLKDTYGENLHFSEDYLDEYYTHRELIRQNVAINSWLGFGIDLALGSVIDDPATPKEHMFLPIYTMRQLDLATLGDQPLASLPDSLFEPRPTRPSDRFVSTPAFWLALVFLAVLALTYIDFKNNTRRRWLDFILFLVPGSIGLMILFLWLLTDHTETAGNLNLIWAFPLHFFVAFIVARKRGPNWVARYALFSIALITVCALMWMIRVQIFSPLIPVVWLTLVARYFFLFWSYQKPKIA